MTFDTASYLRRATGRAKSDVANKLVGMFLHNVSRKLCAESELAVNDSRYGEAVAKFFGSNCCYCGRKLEIDRAAVEHMDGMNRFRLGLHIPGNVLVACTTCNREKRRDDSLPALVLAESGWESFLAHDGSRCPSGCKTCRYWQTIWSDETERRTQLQCVRERIVSFRSEYSDYLKLNFEAREKLAQRMDSIYRDCQNFAETRIEEAVADICGQ